MFKTGVAIRQKTASKSQNAKFLAVAWSTPKREPNTSGMLSHSDENQTRGIVKEKDGRAAGQVDYPLLDWYLNET